MKKIFMAASLAGMLAFSGCQDASKKEEGAAGYSFVEMDINKDGTVDFSEFDKITGNNNDPEGNSVYVRMDSNADGLVSQEEFKAAPQIVKQVKSEAAMAGKAVEAPAEKKAEKPAEKPAGK